MYYIFVSDGVPGQFQIAVTQTIRRKRYRPLCILDDQGTAVPVASTSSASGQAELGYQTLCPDYQVMERQRSGVVAYVLSKFLVSTEEENTKKKVWPLTVYDVKEGV